jgi:uncharacterized protein YjgD (DUF1641 family)
MIKLNHGMLISEVNKTGRSIKTIDDLIKMGPEDKDLIPIIFKHIETIDDEVDKGYLIRCLSVKGFSEISTKLLNEFYTAKTDNYRWIIGNAIYLIEDKSIVDELLQIVIQKKYERSRQMIVNGLGRFKTEKVKKVLIDLLDDDDVRGHALYALGTMKDKSLIPIIVPFTEFAKFSDKTRNTYIKREAKNAIKKLEKVKDK